MILGILGGGQLGRMSAQAAAKLNIKTIILTPEENSPASQVANKTLQAEYTDEQALNTLADQCDVISYEFENIPVETVAFLKKYKPVYPDDSLLQITQDRIQEKTFLNQIGIKTTQWSEINGLNDAQKHVQTYSLPTILKTTRFGYDGKGQTKIDTLDDAPQALQTLGSDTLIAEAVIDFEHELSVIIARDKNGAMVTYGPMLNLHKNHILSETFYPGPFSEEIKTAAIAMTKTLAEKTNLIGVLCLEMFLTRDGTLLANEIAPRTHNSGHWTIDACDASQFENHVRAVCGLPLKEPNPRPARMLNLIGDDVRKADEYARQKNACVHLYGKHDIKPGRKMGHVTFLEDAPK